jgi:hypothetical protein
MQKPFPQISLDRLVANYKKIASQFSDFPEQTKRSQELLDELNETYLHKKIAYLEAKAENPLNTAVSIAEPLGFPTLPLSREEPKERMDFWNPIEEELYQNWEKSAVASKSDFYAEQKRNSVKLTGVLEVYNRSVKNKPGDYLLVDKDSKMPLAFLYSTLVDLHDKMGKLVTVEAAPRDNRHFAYPAYFVISIK